MCRNLSKLATIRHGALGKRNDENSGIPTGGIVTPEACEFENVIGTAIMQLTKRLEYGSRIKVCALTFGIFSRQS